MMHGDARERHEQIKEGLYAKGSSLKDIARDLGVSSAAISLVSMGRSRIATDRTGACTKTGNSARTLVSRISRGGCHAQVEKKKASRVAALKASWIYRM